MADEKKPKAEKEEPKKLEEKPKAEPKKPEKASKKTEPSKDNGCPHARMKKLQKKYNPPQQPAKRLFEGRMKLAEAKSREEWNEICEAYGVPGSAAGRYRE